MSLVLLINSWLIVKIWSSKDSKVGRKRQTQPPKNFWIRILTGSILIWEATKTKTIFKKGDFRLKAENFHASVQCRKGKMSKVCRHFFLNIKENNNCFQQKLSPRHFLCPLQCHCVSVFSAIGLINRKDILLPIVASGQIKRIAQSFGKEIAEIALQLY